MTNQEIIEVCKKHTTTFTVKGSKFRALNLQSLGPVVGTSVENQIKEVIEGKDLHFILLQQEDFFVLRSLTRRIDFRKLDQKLERNVLDLNEKPTKREMLELIEICLR